MIRALLLTVLALVLIAVGTPGEDEVCRLKFVVRLTECL